MTSPRSYGVRRLRARRGAPSRRSATEGFTLLEVMIAVAILIVGSVGVLGLQQAATRGNVQGRQITIASQVTATWLERLRRDALRWNAPGTADASRSTTDFLQDVDPDRWVRLVPADATASYAADWHGSDTRTVADTRFCTHVRLQWAMPGQTIRADVRTVWARTRDGTPALLGDCADADGVTAELAQDVRGLGAVYATTLLRWMPDES